MYHLDQVSSCNFWNKNTPDSDYYWNTMTINLDKEYESSMKEICC